MNFKTTAIALIYFASVAFAADSASQAVVAPATPQQDIQRHTHDADGVHQELLLAPKKAAAIRAQRYDSPDGSFHVRSISKNMIFNPEGLGENDYKLVARNLNQEFVDTAIKSDKLIEDKKPSDAEKENK